MEITWTCRNCGQRVAKVKATTENPLIAGLTEQADEGIINIDTEGNMVVHFFCDDCHDLMEPEEESEIDFLQEPRIH